MAKKYKSNPVNGWVVIDKPAGVTSVQAVSKARWAFQAGKAGHAGTLDPLATGVLAIAFGEATKTVALAQEGAKTYRFTIRLGQATSTDDTEGTVIASSDLRPTDAEIAADLPAYVGDIAQVPPQFSAVKVAGVRAYDLAREGVAPDPAARPLHVACLRRTAKPDQSGPIAFNTFGGDIGRSVIRTPAASAMAFATAAMTGTIEVSPIPRTP